MSPGPELPGPPPTLFCPGEHCLLPGPGGSARAGNVTRPDEAPNAAAASHLVLLRM